jgi:hypothetical protein
LRDGISSIFGRGRLLGGGAKETEDRMSGVSFLMAALSLVVSVGTLLWVVKQAQQDKKDNERRELAARGAAKRTTGKFPTLPSDDVELRVSVPCGASDAEIARAEENIRRRLQTRGLEMGRGKETTESPATASTTTR